MDTQQLSAQQLSRCGLTPYRSFRPRRTEEISGSRIGVGFETLDRFHFDPRRTYPHLAELGAKRARVQTGWNRCERTKGVYDFAWLDEVVDALQSIGVEPFFNLGFGNVLYTLDAPHDSARGYVAFYYGSEAAEAWRRFVHAVAEHFRDRVSHWEVWNEPNAVGFWRPAEPNPDDYVRLLGETVPHLRDCLPDARVAGGVCSAVRPTGPAAYLEKCFQAGMADWIDILVWHPYRAIPEHEYRSEVANLRRLIATYKPELDLWQGECGCQSKGGGNPARLDIAAVVTQTFGRDERPIVAFWYPSDLEKELPARLIDIDIWHGSIARLDRPCLLDPLSGTLYRFESEGAETSGGSTIQSGARPFCGGGSFAVPLVDYPLILTDEAVLPSVESHS